MAEATKRLAFLPGEHGFVGPEVMAENGYPLMIRVIYHRADLDVEESLILSYGGAEYVTATVAYPRTAQEKAERAEIGTDVAHTGYQMRRALDRQTQAIRDFLTR